MRNGFETELAYDQYRDAITMRGQYPMPYWDWLLSGQPLPNFPDNSMFR
jgi:hypothetical protein